VDVVVDTLEEAMTLVEESVKKEEPKSIGLVGNAADIFPELIQRGVIPDVVTDQTPAHDILMYVPIGLTVEQADALRQSDPDNYRKRSLDSMSRQVKAMLEFQGEGLRFLITATIFVNGHLTMAWVRLLISRVLSRPIFVRFFVRQGPFRWVALSGDPEDIYRTDEAILRLFPQDEHLARWIKMAREKIPFQVYRLESVGSDMVKEPGRDWNSIAWWQKELSRPHCHWADHLDAGSVASPNRETEGMRDGSDAISDWPILNALINAVNGATWVSFHHAVVWE